MSTPEHASQQDIPSEKTPSTKKRVIQFIFLAGLVFFIGFTVFAMKTPGLKPVLIYPYEGAMLQPDTEQADLGNIPTDSKVPYTFTLYNVGGKKLHIANVETSCGCTATELEDKSINPGRFTQLNVTLDTSIKLGKTIKTIDIYSNDAEHPVYHLTLTANVVGSKQKAHGRIEVKDKLVLFKGECASCHVNRGIGKVGDELFIADCAMCHGVDAKGKAEVAPGLVGKDYSNPETRARMRAVISDGSGTNPEMSPFHKRNGGPLNDEEIDSLVNYLAFQSKRMKTSPQ